MDLGCGAELGMRERSVGEGALCPDYTEGVFLVTTRIVFVPEKRYFSMNTDS